jgi:hypothetical protein
MTTMIERVALALSECDQEHVMPQPWHYDYAHAAIEAMREPTDSQLAKAEEVVVGYDDFACDAGEIRLQNDCAATAWRKMIDAALNEKETT